MLDGLHGLLGKFRPVRRVAIADTSQLHFLVRQLAVDGKLGTFSDTQRAEVFEILEKAEAGTVEITDYQKILEHVSLLTGSLDSLQIRSSPLYKTMDSNWNIPRVLIISLVFISLFALMFLSVAFNKAKLSHDRITELLLPANLELIHLGSEATDPTIKRKIKLLQQNLATEAYYASSITKSDDFVTTAIRRSLSLKVPEEVGDTAKAEETVIPVPAAVSTVTPFNSNENLKDGFLESKVSKDKSSGSTTDEQTLWILITLRFMETYIYMLATFLMPVTYGVFGAAVYLLRESLPGKTGTLSIQVSSVHVLLRVGLGAVAGIVVGWFNLSGNIRELTATPFAVAFLAGFSFDLVFSFIEKIIAAFSTDGKQDAQPALNARVGTQHSVTEQNNRQYASNKTMTAQSATEPK